MDAEKRKRLFIGIAYQPGKAVKQVLTDLQSRAGNPVAGLRPIAEENLHITLKFLGMIPESEVAMVWQIMQQIVSRHSFFPVQVHGFGCFRQALWLGIANSEDLQRLAADLNQALKVIGIPEERKPFVPHLTVARLRPDARLKISELQASYGHRDWGTVMVDTVTLFESQTLPQGARYSKLFSVPLAS